MVLNKEIQSQQRLDGLAEAPGLASPRQPRKALAASESYLQRLSMASRSSLWQEIPVVRNSTVLLSMTHEDQKLQEVPSGGGGGEGGAGDRREGNRRGSISFVTSSSPAEHRHHRHTLVPAVSKGLGLLPATILPLHFLELWAICYYLLLVPTHTRGPCL